MAKWKMPIDSIAPSKALTTSKNAKHSTSATARVTLNVDFPPASSCAHGAPMRLAGSTSHGFSAAAVVPTGPNPYPEGSARPIGHASLGNCLR